MQECPVNRQRLLATFSEFVHINSTSRQEAAMAARVGELLAEFAVEVVTDQAAERLGGDTNNIIARIPGTLDAPTLLFCAHIDTVAPTTGIALCQADGVLRSSGTTILGADDKAGVAALFELLHLLRETALPHPPLEIVFTVAEEIGVMGSMVLDYTLLTAKRGFVPDTSGAVGTIVHQAPAQQSVHVTITGKAAHAGMAPEQGISAITVAAHAIARMRHGRIDEETTANIGVITGGKATNIVAESVVIDGEARSRDPRKLDAQVAHMRACFLEEAARLGATAQVEIGDVYPAFHLAADSPTVQLAIAGLAPLGVPPHVTATGGGSDANYLNQHGIDTVILSAGYYCPHTPEEYLEEEQLVLLVQWMYEIVRAAGARG